MNANSNCEGAGASASASASAVCNNGVAQNNGIVVAPRQAKEKEKRSWFHSLTRRKKSQSQTSLVGVNSPSVATTASDADAANDVDTAESNLHNNNNEPLHLLVAVRQHHQHQQQNATEIDAASSRKRKDGEKSVFQRFRKKIGLRFRQQRRHAQAADNGGPTTDASAEFLTRSPVREQQPQQLLFNFARTAISLEESEMVPFTHDYKRFIVKKWLERGDTDPNRIMYKACCEMLSQVWYWGEISRRDAQKQLTDKPTGSFLVRDSETSGCQFTLSFRNVNVTLHYRLEYRENYWHFEELQYESIVEMIEDILYRCTNDNFVCFVKVPNEMQPPLPVILKYPLSRYLRMPLLQDLCRRVIQRHASPAEIANLPIPHKLLEYLSELRELVFQS